MRHDPAGVRAQLEESLTLLRCDSFDLYQMHAVTDLDELDARARAVEAIMAARDEGLCRFVGITGHNLTTPAAQLEALRRYDLDTVMFPVNPRLWADPAYRHDAEALLAEAEARDVGVMAIKAVAARPWGERPHTASTWYEAYTSDDEIDRGVRFVLSVPGVHALCTPSDPVLTLATVAAARSVRADGRPRRRERRMRRHGGRGAHLPHARRLRAPVTGPATRGRARYPTIVDMNSGWGRNPSAT